MKKFLVFLTMFLFLFIITACSSNTKEFKNTAEKSVKAEKYDEAIKTLDDAIKQAKDKKELVDLYLFKAQIYSEYLGQYDKALSVLEEAGKENKDDLKILSERAKNYTAKEDYEKALAIYNELIEKNVKLSDIFIQRANLLLLTEPDTDKAEKDLNEAIKIDPKNDKAYTAMARLHRSNGETKEAIKAYNEAIKLNPSAINHLKRAECYYELQEMDKAREDYKIAFQGRNTLDESLQGLVKERLEILQ